jgi:O-antigen/teichoic acid export membrane protein
LVARADKSRFLFAETSFAAIFVVATFLLLPSLGLVGAGVSYGVAYLLYSLLVAAICSRLHGTTISRENLVHLVLAGAAMLALALIGPSAPWIAAGAGLVAAAAAALYAWRHLNEIRRTPSLAAAEGLQAE